jgi:vacuolar protein sorting-associated protein 13A/C
MIISSHKENTLVYYFEVLMIILIDILINKNLAFYLLTVLVPHGYTEVANIPVARPGRRLYNVWNPKASHSDSVLVQIDATEGNKVITLRSPLQVR